MDILYAKEARVPYHPEIYISELFFPSNCEPCTIIRFAKE